MQLKHLELQCGPWLLSLRILYLFLLLVVGADNLKIHLAFTKAMSLNLDFIRKDKILLHTKHQKVKFTIMLTVYTLPLLRLG
mmetsp:Transcript_13801/g.17988  ORF Transcript_13801/g.17988 Transcript_13801/m.17988 type:complete len:82 (-) Transcript_13801:157-402(-)